MWKIIKAEFRYNRIGLLFTFLIAYAIYTIYLLDPVRIFPLFFFVFPLGSVLFGSMKREKRERIFAVLPILIKQRGLAGPVLFIILYYIIMISIWLAELLIERVELANEYHTHWGIMSLIGVTLSLAILFVIHRDLKFFQLKIYRWITGLSFLVFATIFMLIYFGWRINTPIGDGIRILFFEFPAGAILMNLICLVLLYLKIIIYNRRISFLE